MIASALSGGTPPEDWDIDWKYTDGPLENFGWQKKISGNSLSEMKKDGLHLISNGGFVQYICPVLVSQKSVVEIAFEIKKFGSIIVQPNTGLRLILSDGDIGNQVTIIGNGAFYNFGTNYSDWKKVKDMELNTSYVIRLLFESKTKNEIDINGEVQIETPEMSGYYANGNKIFQQSSGETVLKALRYKFIER